MTFQTISGDCLDLIFRHLPGDLNSFILSSVCKQWRNFLSKRKYPYNGISLQVLEYLKQGKTLPYIDVNYKDLQVYIFHRSNYNPSFKINKHSFLFPLFFTEPKDFLKKYMEMSHSYIASRHTLNILNKYMSTDIYIQKKRNSFGSVMVNNPLEITTEVPNLDRVVINYSYGCEKDVILSVLSILSLTDQRVILDEDILLYVLNFYEVTGINLIGCNELINWGKVINTILPCSVVKVNDKISLLSSLKNLIPQDYVFEVDGRWRMNERDVFPVLSVLINLGEHIENEMELLEDICLHIERCGCNENDFIGLVKSGIIKHYFSGDYSTRLNLNDLRMRRLGGVRLKDYIVYLSVQRYHNNYWLVRNLLDDKSKESVRSLLSHGRDILHLIKNTSITEDLRLNYLEKMELLSGITKERLISCFDFKNLFLEITYLVKAMRLSMYDLYIDHVPVDNLEAIKCVELFHAYRECRISNEVKDVIIENIERGKSRT